jgi:hypothetical protein
MDKTTSELVKTLTGKGEVSEDGMKICNARYKLRIYQEFIITERKEKVEGNQETKGTISGCDLDLLLGKEKLTLHLNDGTRLDFFVKNNRGGICATGGLYGS